MGVGDARAVATTAKTVRKHTRRQLARRIVQEIRHHPANAAHPNQAVVRAVAYQVRKRLGRGPMHLRAYGLDLELPRTSGSLSNLVYFGEAFEWETIHFVRAYLRPGDNVVDVGVNVGLFAFASLEQTGPDGIVHCFEPLTWCVDAIRRCAIRNDLGSRLDLRRVASSDAPGTAEFDADLDVSSHLRWDSAPSASRHSIEVETVMLDSALELDHPIALAKLDVERRVLEPWDASDSDFVAVRRESRAAVDARLAAR